MARKVFRHYDRQALDREYNNRAKVPDHGDWLARYPRESAAARAERPVRLDVAYGSHPGETLDVFPASGPGPAPIQIFVHGGYWQWLDKGDFSFVARALGSAGAAVVVINYALIPSVGMDELVRQCRAAVAWTSRHATSFGGDPHRIYVSGHSAGGHLVAMLMATDWKAFGVPADVIKGGTGISGLYDLEPIRLSYLNDVLKLSPAEARRNSPLHLAPPPSGRLLLAVGGDEGPEYHRQTDDLAAAWRQQGLACEVMDLPGINHFSIIAQLEDPKSELSRAILGQTERAALPRPRGARAPSRARTARPARPSAGAGSRRRAPRGRKAGKASGRRRRRG
ncbi:MAG TPA: alpha/beta hydrolase [Methylomirabilota bacterium]|jgi:arylformamidase